MYFYYVSGGLAVLGVLLNLFQSFVNIPFMGSYGLLDLYSIISEASQYSPPGRNIYNFKFYLFIALVITTPIFASAGAVRAFMRKGGFIPLAVSAVECVIFSIILQVMVSDINREMGGLGSVAVSAFVPIVWAVVYGVASFFAFKAGGVDINTDSAKELYENLKSSASSLTERLPDQQRAKEIYENLKTSASSIAERLPEQLKRGMDTATSKLSELKERYAQSQEGSPVNEYERMSLKEMITGGLSALKDSDFRKAEEFFDHALARNPKSSNAYIGKLMVKFRARNTNELVSVPALLENEELFQHALSFANPKMKAILDKYVTVNRLRASMKRKKV